MLSENTIKELQNILCEDGHILSYAEASEVGHALVGYFDVLARNFTEERSQSPPDPP